MFLLSLPRSLSLSLADVDGQDVGVELQAVLTEKRRRPPPPPPGKTSKRAAAVAAVAFPSGVQSGAKLDEVTTAVMAFLNTAAAAVVVVVVVAVAVAVVVVAFNVLNSFSERFVQGQALLKSSLPQSLCIHKF